MRSSRRIQVDGDHGASCQRQRLADFSAQPADAAGDDRYALAHVFVSSFVGIKKARTAMCGPVVSIRGLQRVRDFGASRCGVSGLTVGRPSAAAEVALEFLPQLHVALGQLVHHRPGRLPQHAAHLLAELLLLFHEQGASLRSR